MQANVGKGYKGMGMEGRIANWYARNTARDMPDFVALAQRVTATLPAGTRILEVAPGPGYLSIEIARRGAYQVIGLDISHTFVEIAARNAREANVDIDFRQGNASAMPFAAGSFDLVVCRAAFKNFSEPVKAISEMCRVLKPGGRAMIIDLRRDVSQKTINQYVDRLGVGFFSAWMMKLTFRFMLIKRAYTREQVSQFVALSPFGRYKLAENPIGFELWMYK